MTWADCEEHGTRIFSLNGRLTADAAGEFKKAVLPFLQPGCRLLMDLKDLEYIDSTGLGVLVALRQKAADLGGVMPICELRDKARMIFELTRAETIFTIYPTRTEALDSFR